MRIGLDLQLAAGTSTGIGEYARGLAQALAARGIDVAELSLSALDPWRFDRRVLWDQVGLPLASLRAKVDLLHCASGTMPLVRRGPTVVTVHDVAWLRVQGHTRAYARWYFGRFALQRYRSADRIVVDSEFSRTELLSVAPLPPESIDVVYPGVASDVFAVVRRAPEPFVLAVGTVERRKNLITAIRALAALPGFTLVVAGPLTEYRSECERAASDAGVAARVEFRGYVARPELLDLYARAALVAMPSRYEGFGYGAAQALCAGVPLVSSNASSLPEVCGEDALLLDPDDVAAWSRAFADVASDNAYEVRAADARERARRRFTWSRTAERMHDVYERVLGPLRC